MPTAEDQQLRKERTAWWLHACRRVDGRGQKALMQALGYKSPSAISDLESTRNPTPPSLDKLQRAAVIYGVPITLFVSPPMTDQDRIRALQAGGQLEPDDPLIPLSALRALSVRALERLAKGDLSVLQGTTPANDEQPPPGEEGTAA